MEKQLACQPLSSSNWMISMRALTDKTAASIAATAPSTTAYHTPTAATPWRAESGWVTLFHKTSLWTAFLVKAA